MYGFIFNFQYGNINSKVNQIINYFNYNMFGFISFKVIKRNL